MNAPVIAPMVDLLLADALVQSGLSRMSADITEFMVDALIEIVPTMNAKGFLVGHPDRAEIVVAIGLGWALGFGIPHQDEAARLACLEERLALIRRAAEQSAAVAAAVDLRSLN